MKKIAIIIATWFGSGFMPLMPGTWGSLFSMPLCYMVLMFVSHLSPVILGYIVYLSICVLILLVGKWSVEIAIVELGSRANWKGKMETCDQGQIVIDEVLGMLIACVPLIYYDTHFLWPGFFMAFGLFRFFDVVKVWPANFFDNMKNAWGVILDDVCAGVYAAISLYFLLPLFSL